MLLREDEYRNEFYALKHLKCGNADDPLTDPRTAGYVETYLKPLRITSMLDAVIKLSGMSLGILCFEHVDKPHHRHQEISFASQLADKLSSRALRRMRIRAEVELRASEARFRALVEQAPGAILVYDVDRGHVIARIGKRRPCLPVAATSFSRADRSVSTCQSNPTGAWSRKVSQTDNRRALAGEFVVFERQIHNANEEDLVCEVRLARLPRAKATVGCFARVSSIPRNASTPRKSYGWPTPFLQVRSRARRTAFLSLKPSAGWRRLIANVSRCGKYLPMWLADGIRMRF